MIEVIKLLMLVIIVTAYMKTGYYLWQHDETRWTKLPVGADYYNRHIYSLIWFPIMVFRILRGFFFGR